MLDLKMLYNCKHDQISECYKSENEDGLIEIVVIANSNSDLDRTSLKFNAISSGDVYQYEVPKIGEHAHNFYGKDHELSGLLDSAKKNIDWQFEHIYIPARQRELRMLSLSLKYDIELPQSLMSARMLKIILNKCKTCKDILRYVKLDECLDITSKEEAIVAINMWKLEKL